MKQENSPSVVVSEPNSSEASQSSTGEDVQRHWEGVVKRRSFLKGLGIASATQNGGAVATIKAFTDDLLFHGQSSGSSLW
jgi:hypothetical protein